MSALSDWQVGPRNRWTYQHVAELLPTVTVRRGVHTRELPAGEPIDLGEAPYEDGVAVLRDGALALERYANGMTPETRHLSQSVAKSVLGALVHTLALDADTPATELVPEVADSGYRGATLRHLLDMTAATGFVEDYLSFWRYDAACGWHDPIPGAPGSMLEFLATEIGSAEHPHGTRFHYASPNTDLLGIATARAAGAPLEDLIATHVWGPAGAEHDALLAVDPTGVPVISGGFNATLRDYTRFGAFVLEGDLTVDRQIDDPRASGYASQWWRLHDGRLAARGIHGQLVAVDRGNRTVTTILSSWPHATDPGAEQAQFEVIEATR